MFCPKCGKENVEGAAFCGSCGNKIEIQPTNINEAPVETPVSEVVSESVVTPEQPKPKKSKKILIIIIAALLAVVIVFVVLYFFVFRGPKTANEVMINNYFDPDSPIAVGKMGKAGLISPDGKEILKAEYPVVGPCYHDVCYYAKTIEDVESGIYTFIDYKGKEIVNLKSSDSSYPIHYYDTWILGNTIYDYKLKELFKSDKISGVGYGYFLYIDEVNKKAGMLNQDGKELFVYDGREADISVSENSITDDDYYFAVFVKDKVQGIYSTKKKEMVYNLNDTSENKINALEYNVFEVDTDKGTKYFYFRDGEIKYQADDEFKVADYKDDIIAIDYDDYYDINKKAKVEDFDILSLNENIYKTKYDMEIKEENYIDRLYIKGKNSIETAYTSLEFLDSDVFSYILNNKNKKLVIGLDESKHTCTIINVKNKAKEVKVINDCEELENDENLFLVFEKTNGEYLVYNLLSGEEKTFNKYSEITTASNYIIVDDKSNNSSKYYNNEFKEIYKTYITAPEEISDEDLAKPVDFRVYSTKEVNDKECIYGSLESGVLKEGKNLKLYTFNDGVISFKIDELYVDEIRLPQTSNNGYVCIYSKSIDINKVEEDNIISDGDIAYSNKFNVAIEFDSYDEDDLKVLCDGEEWYAEVRYSRDFRATFKCNDGTKMTEDELSYSNITMTTNHYMPFYENDWVYLYRNGYRLGEITEIKLAK